LKAGRNIHERILQVRKSLGLSQKDFADGIKVSRAYQGAFENSDRKINDRMILIICTTYGVNEAWLRNGTGEMFGKETNVRLENAIVLGDEINRWEKLFGVSKPPGLAAVFFLLF
jgi:transcriptional regulator with XRE-family HTH domain